MSSLRRRIQAGSYDGYAYAYPHKTAYRRIHPAVPLRDAWEKEDKSEVFLYTHLPFCEMRCGFCNLFTTVRPAAELVRQTLAAIAEQSAVTADAIGAPRITQAAFGGGTPSLLSAEQIAALLATLERHWAVNWRTVPTSFETSPATLDREKLAALREHGIARLSLGVQSFDARDLKALGRPQDVDATREVCEWIRDAGFPVFNIDLIYGATTQTAEGWRRCVETAIEVGPDEVYLYPLYVRELTGLGRRGHSASEHRRALFRVARDRLLDADYEPISMRLFRRKGCPTVDTDYCCQDDGMIGLGPGARSYTRGLHYSSEYAVGQLGVRRIIEGFNARRRHDVADFGVELNADEQRRRYVIKSLLRSEGLRLADYRRRFSSELFEDLPQLDELQVLRLATLSSERLELTTLGLEHSDTIGPWLYSEEVQSRMKAYRQS